MYQENVDFLEGYGHELLESCDPSSCSGTMFFGMSPSHSLHTIVIREIATSFLAGNQQKPAKSTVKNFGFSSVSIHGPTNFRTLPKP